MVLYDYELLNEKNRLKLHVNKEAQLSLHSLISVFVFLTVRLKYKNHVKFPINSIYFDKTELTPTRQGPSSWVAS